MSTEQFEAEHEIRTLRSNILEHLGLERAVRRLPLGLQSGIARFIGRDQSKVADADPMLFYSNDPDYEQWEQIKQRMEALRGPHAQTLLKMIIIKNNIPDES